MNETNLLLLMQLDFSQTLDVHLVFKEFYLYIFSNLVLFGVMCNNVFCISIALCVFKKKPTVVVVAFSVGCVDHHVLKSQSLTLRQSVTMEQSDVLS